MPSQYAIMSPLWGPEAHAVYNMSWRTPSSFVPAIDVTANYAAPPIGPHTWNTLPSMMAIVVISFLAVGGAGWAYKVNKERSAGWTTMA